MTDGVLPRIEMNQSEAMEEFTRTLKGGELRDLFIKRTDEKDGNRIRVRKLGWHSFTICEWYDKDNKVRASVTRFWEDHPLCPKYETFVDWAGIKFGGWYLIDGKEYPYGKNDCIELRWSSMMAGIVPCRPNESDPAWWKRKEQMDRENRLLRVQVLSNKNSVLE